MYVPILLLRLISQLIYCCLFVCLDFHHICLPILVFAISNPRSHLSHDYQLVMEKANICFFCQKWLHHATLQGNWTHSEESSNFPLLHTSAHRADDWLCSLGYCWDWNSHFLHDSTNPFLLQQPKEPCNYFKIWHLNILSAFNCVISVKII